MSFPAFSRVVRAGFGQRRKSLRNSLEPLVGSSERAEQLLRRAGIDPGARPESLDVEAFVAITRALESD